MLAQEPGAEPVERPGPQALGQRAERRASRPAQLVGRGPRERQGQDLGRVEPLVLDQPLDPVGEDARLATAGTAREQQWPGRVRHGRPLRRVERGEGIVERCEGHATPE